MQSWLLPIWLQLGNPWEPLPSNGTIDGLKPGTRTFAKKSLITTRMTALQCGFCWMDSGPCASVSTVKIQLILGGRDRFIGMQLIDEFIDIIHVARLFQGSHITFHAGTGQTHRQA